MTAAFGDLSQLVGNFSAASGQGFESAAADVIRSTAEAIKADAERRAPRKTGALANSITVVFVGPTKAIIGPTKKYGVFQEFGTGTRGEFPTSAYIIRPVRSAKLHFKINGQDIFTKEVHHPGIPAHPFMRPAIAEQVSKLEHDLGQQGASVIIKGG